MKSLLLVLVALVAFAAATYNPQTVTVIPLASGITNSGVLPPNPSNPYYVKTFAIFVPANATALNVTVVNTNSSACSFISYFVRANGAPCDDSAYSTSQFFCSNVAGSYTSSTYNQLFLPGYMSSLSEFKPNDFFYIGVGPEGYSTQCMYSVTATVVSTCPSGQVAAADSLSSNSDTICLTPTIVSGTGTTTLNITGGGVTTPNLYEIIVPLDVGNMVVTLNITDGSADVYGRQYSPYNGNYGTSICSDTSGSSTSGGYFSYSLICYVPRAGSFFISVQEADMFNGTITFTFQNCGPNVGGYNCSFPQMPLNLTTALTTGVQYFVPYSGGYLGYYQSIFYVDIPANYVSNDIMLYATSSGSGLFEVRINGFPESYVTGGLDDSSESQSISSSDPGVWGLTQFDFVFAGRYYFIIQCSSSAGCNGTIGGNATAPTTTGSTTGVQSTTGLTTASTTGSTTGLTTASTTASTTGSTTALTTGSTTGSTTALSTTGRTTGVTTRAPTTGTTTAPALTTAAERSGFEYMIPSFVVLLAALLF